MLNVERVLRRYWFVLLLAGVVGGGVAFAVASSTRKVYTATASLSFTDITELEGLIGSPAGTLQTPAELAAASTSTVTLRNVIAAANAALDNPMTVDQLTNHVSASVSSSSNLVLVTVSAHTPNFAARAANAVAGATADFTNQTTRSLFAREARQLIVRIRALPHATGNITTLQNEQADLARLQTLSIVARPAQLAQAADPPTSPTSPKPGFDTGLGVFFGLLIGGGALFLRERLSDTLRSPEQLSETLGYPHAITVPRTVLGRSPIGGPNPWPEHASASVIAQFGMLRRTLELGSDGGAGVIVVTSAGAQDGKSTVSLSLAHAFASVGRRVVLLECDLRRPSLAGRLGLPATPGLIDHLAHGVDPGDVVRGIALPDPKGETIGGPRMLACVLAGEPLSDPSDLLASGEFREMLNALSAAYDVVIVDTPPALAVADAQEILPLADAVVLCARAHRTKIRELEALKALIEQLPERPTLAVSTGWSAREMNIVTTYGGYSAYYQSSQSAR